MEAKRTNGRLQNSKRENGVLDQEGGSGDGEKCMDLGYIWE